MEKDQNKPTVLSLGTFIFHTPPLALLSSSLDQKPTFKVTLLAEVVLHTPRVRVRVMTLKRKEKGASRNELPHPCLFYWKLKQMKEKGRQWRWRGEWDSVAKRAGKVIILKEGCREAPQSIWEGLQVPNRGEGFYISTSCSWHHLLWLAFQPCVASLKGDSAPIEGICCFPL